MVRPELSQVICHVPVADALPFGWTGGPIKAFLENPTLQPSERKKGIDGLLKGLGGTPSELTRNTFEVLAENGRMADAEKVRLVPLRWRVRT